MNRIWKGGKHSPSTCPFVLLAVSNQDVPRSPDRRGQMIQSKPTLSLNQEVQSINSRGMTVPDRSIAVADQDLSVSNAMRAAKNRSKKKVQNAVQRWKPRTVCARIWMARENVQAWFSTFPLTARARTGWAWREESKTHAPRGPTIKAQDTCVTSSSGQEAPEPQQLPRRRRPSACTASEHCTRRT